MTNVMPTGCIDSKCHTSKLKSNSQVSFHVNGFHSLGDGYTNTHTNIHSKVISRNQAHICFNKISVVVNNLSTCFLRHVDIQQILELRIALLPIKCHLDVHKSSHNYRAALILPSISILGDISIAWNQQNILQQLCTNSVVMKYVKA